MGYSTLGRKELDMTERLHFTSNINLFDPHNISIVLNLETMNISQEVSALIYPDVMTNNQWSWDLHAGILILEFILLSV